MIRESSTRLREWARYLKREVVVLWVCTRHPRTPLLAKALAVALVGYALSPIDLIPDFIPLMGLTDDFGVLVWVYNSISTEIDKFLAWEKSITTT